MGCPKCGGFESREIGLGYFECLHPVPNVYTSWEPAGPGGQMVPLQRSSLSACGHRYLAPSTQSNVASKETCACDLFVTGTCQTCGVGYCNDCRGSAGLCRACGEQRDRERHATEQRSQQAQVDRRREATSQILEVRTRLAELIACGAVGPDRFRHLSLTHGRVLGVKKRLPSRCPEGHVGCRRTEHAGSQAAWYEAPGWELAAFTVTGWTTGRNSKQVENQRCVAILGDGSIWTAQNGIARRSEERIETLSPLALINLGLTTADQTILASRLTKLIERTAG